MKGRWVRKAPRAHQARRVLRDQSVLLDLRVPLGRRDHRARQDLLDHQDHQGEAITVTMEAETAMEAEKARELYVELTRLSSSEFNSPEI